MRLELEAILEQLSEGVRNEFGSGLSALVLELYLDVKTIRIDPARSANQLKVLQQLTGLTERLTDQDAKRHARDRDVAGADADLTSGAADVLLHRCDEGKRRGLILGSDRADNDNDDRDDGEDPGHDDVGLRALQWAFGVIDHKHVVGRL